tara:strand:- start:82 stop:1236 length:1155 start_codon:yes stop_codon:yes gene_type:complete
MLVGVSLIVDEVDDNDTSVVMIDVTGGGGTFTSKEVPWGKILAILLPLCILILLLVSIAIGVVISYVSDLFQLSEGQYGDGDEYGYRLDIDSDLYFDLGANKNGFQANDEIPSFDSTVYIEGTCIDEPDYYCGGSGVIVSSRWVFTAAHVAIDLDVSDTYVVIGSDYENYEDAVAVSEIFVHPSYIDEEYDYDFAMLKLEWNVNQQYVAGWVGDREDLDLISREAYISGFGDLDEEFADCGKACLEDQSGYFSQRRAWTNIIDRVTGSATTGNSYIVYDFDSPDGKNNSLRKGSSGFSYDQGDFSYAGKGSSSQEPTNLEGTSVFGDSGGPMYANLGGEWLVVAVTAHGGEYSDYGDVAFNSRVSVYYDWICSHSDSGARITNC